MNIMGTDIYSLCEKLFHINRSITGDGLRETLTIIKRELPRLKIHEIPSGTKCFDWTIPKEWNLREAYILDPEGNKIVDFKENNLHVVGYSVSIDKSLSLSELNRHLYSLAKFPDAIPYITSYYGETWGFCLPHSQREQLKDGKYKVYIDSNLKDGSLTYAELLIKGKCEQEIFLSTYICHPSMANDNLSGPSLITYLAKYIQKIKNRRYSYRIIFIPETIGSIMYLSKNIEHLKKYVVAGFNVTCVGDNNNYSYLPSRKGKTLADKVALHVLKHLVHNIKEYSFLDRGSDERQYNYPGVDLPVCSVMRTKYGEFDEYHTSLDNLAYISPDGLNGSYEVYRKIIESIENNYTYMLNELCEPQLGKRGLYPTVSTKKTHAIVNNMMNFLVYCDGKLDLVEIAEKVKTPIWDLYDIANGLISNKLIKIVN